VKEKEGKEFGEIAEQNIPDSLTHSMLFDHIPPLQCEEF